MKRIVITINTENAAFEDNGYEIERILRELSKRFSRNTDLIAPIFDINGNRVGSVSIED